MTNFLLVSLLAIGGSCSLAAEPQIYETVITAPLASRLPLSRSRIDRAEIELSNATSVQELFKLEPGIDFVSERAGGQASLFLRGGESSHTLVVIDGTPVNDPSDPSRRFDFTHLDPLAIESIEFLRGPESIAYGSDALSGVILIRTKRISSELGAKPKLRARQEYGTFETFRSSGGFSARPSPNVGYDFHAYRHSTEGYSAANVAGGDRDTRERIGVGGGLQWEPAPDHRLSAEGEWDRLQEDLDAGAALDDPNSKSDSRNVRAHVAAEGSILHERAITYRAEYAFNRVRRFLDDPLDVANPFPFSSTYVGSAHEGKAHMAFRHADHTDLKIGASLRKESAFAVGSESIPTRDQTLSGAFGLIEHDPAPRWKLDGGARFDRVNGTSWNEWTGRLGAGFDAVPDQLHFFVGGGTGFKAPSLYQRFAPRFGNLDLSPERSANAELGALAWKEIGLSGFYTRYQNLIDFDSSSSRYRNGGKAEVLGLELKQDSKLDEVLQGFSVKSALTAMRARSLSTGLDLPRRARWKFGSRFGWEHGMYRVGIEPSYTGTRRDTSSRSSGLLPEAFRLDAFAGVSPAYWIDFGFRAEDFLDRQAPEALEYTAPGRILTVSVSARL